MPRTDRDRGAGGTTGGLASILAPSLVAVTLGCSGPGPVSAPETRGVVLVSVDTLRADHLGCYGYSRPTSPFLDRLAARGVQFVDAVSPAPWTLPAHASLLTGVFTSGHGAVEARSAISPSVKTAAEIFRDGGFSTGGVVASWFVSREYGFARGFDWFEDFDTTARRSRLRKVVAGTVVDEAARWLRKSRNERFFLFVHLYDPHYDYSAPEPYGEMFDTGYRGRRPRYRHYDYYKRHPLSEVRLRQEVALYDGEIRYVDSQIERLWGVLDELGRASSTLLVVTADHGEEFFERGSWGHGHTLFDELVRVPLIVAGPGVARGRRVTDQVCLVDVLPTLLESVGLVGPADVDGETLWPFLASPARDSRPMKARPALLETYRYQTAVVGLRRHGWKLLSDLRTSEERLFSLESDPGEARNLATEREDVLADLRARMVEMLLAVTPNRWMARWPDAAEEPVVGELVTDGRLIEVTAHGEGARQVQAGAQRATFELAPGSGLELLVLPPDATLTFAGLRRRGGAAVPVLAGDGTASIPGEPVTVSGPRDRWIREPGARPGALGVWRMERRESASDVELDEKTRDALEALGYVM